MFTLSDEVIDPTRLRGEVLCDTSGGYASFEGWVRNHHEGKAVSSLEYSAYTELAEKEGQRILEEVMEKFSINHARCQHRVGHLQIGDIAVAIAVSSAHRDAAFQACRYIIDEVKQRVPIWKKEHYTDETAAWPACKGCSNHQH